MSPNHLLYHLYPTNGTIWKWNLELLFQRWHLFDGRKLIYVAIDDGGPSSQDVHRLFRGRGAEIHLVHNRANEGEAVSFLQGWQVLQHESGQVFRAHGKGVSREGTAEEPAVRRWVEHLYRESLDDWHRVHQALQTHPIAGPLLRDGAAKPMPDAAWHFCGAFYWVRLDALRTRPWRVRDNSRFAAEAWPGRVFHRKEAACLGRENRGHLSPYESAFWETPKVKQAPTVAVVVPCHNYGHWLAECLESILSQTLCPCDVLVVDDGSTDETPDVAAGFRDRGVRYLRVNHGDPQLARRDGISATRSDFVCCVDADDRLSPGYLKTGLESLGDAEVAIAYSPIQEFGNSTRWRDLSPGDIERHNWIHAGAIIRRIAITQSGAFESTTESALEDWEIWKRILRCGWKTVRNSEPYFYRRHQTSRSQLRQQHRVILTTYLTSQPDPQGGRTMETDRWDLVAPWAEGIARYGLRGVILHDGLSKSFTDRLAPLGIQTVSVDRVPPTTHTNNWRYRLAAEWLSSHPVTAAFMTDLFDVAVKGNPFELMDPAYDLWIGIEPWTIDDTTPAGRWMLSRLEGTYGTSGNLLGRPILNAGITGGSRAALLALWWDMWSQLSHRGPNHVKANDMAALNMIIYHRQDLHRVWRHGAPLHSEFKSYQHDASVCFVHK